MRLSKQTKKKGEFEMNLSFQLRRRSRSCSCHGLAVTGAHWSTRCVHWRKWPTFHTLLTSILTLIVYIFTAHAARRHNMIKTTAWQSTSSRRYLSVRQCKRLTLPLYTKHHAPDPMKYYREYRHDQSGGTFPSDFRRKSEFVCVL